MNEKEIIRLRRKRIQSGESLYLDSYFKGKRRYEFLRLYLIPERTKADKIKNEQTLRLANTIKSKRLVELFNNKYGFSNEKPEVNLIQYIRLVMENKERQGKIGIKSTFETLIYHLTKYRGTRILLSDLDDRYTQGFVLYLSTAISRTSGKTLKTSSQHNIYTSLKTIVHQAIKDDLLTTDPTKSIDPPRMILPHKEFLTEEELKRLIQTPCSKEIVKRSFLFCCFTGLRISDVRELTWKKVIFEEQGCSTLGECNFGLTTERRQIGLRSGLHVTTGDNDPQNIERMDDECKDRQTYHLPFVQTYVCNLVVELGSGHLYR